METLATSAIPAERTAWYTFGFDHVHAVAGRTYDKDVVVQITAPDPRAVMVRTFGTTWSMEYLEPPDAEFMADFPRGIVVLGPTGQVLR